jgi:hypothetical protein
MLGLLKVNLRAFECTSYELVVSLHAEHLDCP